MTSRRHDPSDAPGPHDEFWGEQAEWTPQRPPSPQRAGFGATVARWWDAVLGGGVDSGRTHGGPAGHTSSGDDPDPTVDEQLTADRGVERDPVSSGGDHAGRDHDRTDGDRKDHAGDDLGDDAWEMELQSQPSRHPGVDPLLARLGGLAVIVTLAAPLVLGFTGSGSDSPSAVSMVGTITTTPASESADPTTTVVAAPPAPAPTTVSTLATPFGPPLGIATTTPDTTPPDAGDAEPDASAPATAVVATLQDAPEPEPEPAETAPVVTTAPCGARYDVAAGDYWIRLADAAGVSLADLLAVNNASVDTMLVAGRSICLPVGAATPSPPPPPTTAAPAPTAPPTTAAPTRPAPTTPPAPPPTTVPNRPAAVPQSQAVAIIRDVWPDDLEERALEIAWRESNHLSNVNNYCCYGLFQIHWTAHRSWLATIGITSASQLFDPVANTNAAYALYQRSGGFGPWGG